ncbi:hypothetical protein AYO38_08305 [bacterium SCGC AG-212-C10]|nr:hypothetical protein AYO38_08305 [bacterium SCGC AG-212-C10]
MYLAAEQSAITVADTGDVSREMQPWRPGLPSPAVRAAAAVAVGTALQVGIALAVKAFANSGTREVTRQAAVRPRRSREVVERPAEQPALPATTLGIADVTETVIFQRRWRFRE